MLAAARANKNMSRFARIEDHITSSVFGPLQYCDNRARIEIVKTLLPKLGAKLTSIPEEVEVSLNFWQKLSIQETKVEPDLIIHIEWYEQATVKRLHIIVEVKWNSPASNHNGISGDQLDRQWRACKNAYAEDELFLVYLVKNRDKAADSDFLAFQRGNEMRAANSALVSWVELADLMTTSRLKLIGQSKMQNQSKMQVRLWAEDIKHFLNRLGVEHFAGFANISILRYAVSKLIGAWRFTEQPINWPKNAATFKFVQASWTINNEVTHGKC